MKAFKFVVQEEAAIPSRPGYFAAWCAALVFADSLEQARELLRQRNIDNRCLPWEEVASVTEVPVDREGVALIIW